MNAFDPIERQLFLDGIYLKYGYDFKEYSEASFDRRMRDILKRTGDSHLFDLLKKLIQSESMFDELLPKLTITTTEFFRNPTFFLYLREHVLPVLKTYPRLKIWTAGCSTGEELYSLAIILKEMDLLSRSVIHATDINTTALEKAKKGIFEQSRVEDFNKNYVASGGVKSPSEYYTAEYNLFRVDPELRKNIVFSEHNLTSDSVFVEAHLVLCRNVLIYFNKPLQSRVFKLISQSMIYKGFLCLGNQETVAFSEVAPLFESFDAQRGVYQLKTQPTFAGIV